MKVLDGNVAWVTGGGRGIGRAIALELASRGAKVLVSGRSEGPLGEVVGEIAHQGGRAKHLVADVRRPADLDAAARTAVETFGGLDIVVANAGTSGAFPIGADDVGPATDIINTNLLGCLYTFRAATRVMNRPGRLLAMSSVLGKFGVAEYAAYCASKAGIQGLVRALAHELGPRSITANAICPGWVDTDMSGIGIRAMAAAMNVSEAEAKRVACEAFPLKRFLQPEEVARFVAFLAGPDAAGVTGQALSICGGSTAFGA
jgi:NAD(P)-dependent dehydrogenase (short-subunit alcohol dehydrogenase family)